MKLISENSFDAAESQMFEKNLGLVRHVVSRFVRRNIEDSDFYSIGCMALLKAIKTFDPSKSNFSTWATKIIKNSIISELRKNKKEVIVFSCVEDSERESKLIDKAEKDIPINLINELIKIKKSDTEIEIENKKILQDHYLNGKSLSEIGKRMGISKERVRQKAKEAILKIRIKNKKILKEFMEV